MKKKIYLISGLGANSKVYERIDFSDYDTTFLDWIIPFANEPIEDYAKRMSSEIDKTEPVILIGMSFGGIMVQEVAKFVNAEKIIIISSVKKREELPTIYRISSKLGLHELIPSFFFHNQKLLGSILFGKNKQSTLKIMDKYFTMKDLAYSRWAIDAVVNWKGPKQENNILHIHGTKDTVFPKKYISNATFVKDGTHLMIFNKSKIVNQHIQDFINK